MPAFTYMDALPTDDFLDPFEPSKTPSPDTAEDPTSAPLRFDRALPFAALRARWRGAGIVLIGVILAVTGVRAGTASLRPAQSPPRTSRAHSKHRRDLRHRRNPRQHADSGRRRGAQVGSASTRFSPGGATVVENVPSPAPVRPTPSTHVGSDRPHPNRTVGIKPQEQFGYLGQ